MEKTTVKASVSMGASVSPKSLMPDDIESAYRVAQSLADSQFIPTAFRGKMPDVFAAIVMGMEIGLPPMRALQSIAVVNGRPSVWGDTQLALVRSSGELESFSEYYEGTEYNDDFKAVCRLRRKGEAEDTIEAFSVADAKKATLWGKTGPWTTNPKRMLRYRCRAFALRDKFPDVLLGITHTREELEDIAPIKDVTPSDAAQEVQKMFQTSEQPKAKPGRKKKDGDPRLVPGFLNKDDEEIDLIINGEDEEEPVLFAMDDGFPGDSALN